MADISFDDIRAALSVDNVRRHVEHITGNIPSRLAGSENARRMAAYSLNQMEAAGLDATAHVIPGMVSFPEAGRVDLLSPETGAIEANTLGHSPNTPEGGLEGQLVYVGAGGYEHYDGKDVRGRIILCELSYVPGRHEKQRIAAEKGAIGCVMMNWGPPDNHCLPFGSVKPAWGNPTVETVEKEMPVLPCVGIARTDGLRLKAMCENGTLRARMHAKAGSEWRNVEFTTGFLRGRSDDFAVVGGHQDSWPGPQATDNAAGNAVIYELARVFAGHAEHLRRGLLCGLWIGHETGTMIGSSWYVDRNWDRLRDHAVGYVQIDQPACVGTSIWGSGSAKEMKRFHEEVERRECGDIPVHWNRVRKTGDSSFFGIGVPMIYAHTHFTKEELERTAVATLGWWHHSVENTIDKLDWDLMDVHLRVYAGYLWELCTAPIIPYEFVSVADQVTERLQELQQAGRGIGLDATAAQATALRASAERLDAVVRDWQRHYRAGEVTDEAPAALLNECIKGLSRRLLAIASTARGPYRQDPYSFTPQNSMLPGLYDVPKLDGMPEGEARWMLEAWLVQQRNRITDALADSRRLIEATLERL
ncbi:MAG: M28 family peptidase [Acetobacterales bacterium]